MLDTRGRGGRWAEDAICHSARCLFGTKLCGEKERLQPSTREVELLR